MPSGPAKLAVDVKTAAELGVPLCAWGAAYARVAVRRPRTGVRRVMMLIASKYEVAEQGSSSCEGLQTTYAVDQPRKAQVELL